MWSAIHEAAWLALPLTSGVVPAPIARIGDIYLQWLTEEDVTSA